MARWRDVAAAEPEFAERVQHIFDAHLHKTIATLRRDGSPRISGIEAKFREGDLWLGMMPGSQKARDVQRDARIALHSATVDTELAEGDAKLSGRAIEVTDGAAIAAALGEVGDDAHAFVVDVAEVVLTRVGEPRDHLVIEVWSEGGGLRRLERR